MIRALANREKNQHSKSKKKTNHTTKTQDITNKTQKPHKKTTHTKKTKPGEPTTLNHKSHQQNH